MLTRRTNVLFTEEDYIVLQNLSKKTNKTIGELVRRAVKKTFKTEKALGLNEKAFNNIKRLTKNIDTSGLDYKALINYGRKY